jgi:hypothetical protein
LNLNRLNTRSTGNDPALALINCDNDNRNGGNDRGQVSDKSDGPLHTPSIGGRVVGGTR